MAESEFQRHLRKTQYAAEDSARDAHRAAEYQAIAAEHAERAADAAEASYAVHLQALDEQRKHAFVMWRQTPDGQAFVTWQERVILSTFSGPGMLI